MKDSDVSRFLNQRSDKFTIILNDNELQLFKNTRHVYLTLNCDEDLSPVFLACIKHDKDFDEETKQYKTVHYHVVIQCDKICRIGTMIHKISDLFHCNENQITIDKCNSIVMQTRYLCHLDDFDKAPYYINDVECNDEEVLRRYFELVIVRDIHDLISVVKRYNYDLETIMCNVAHYDKWRRHINDLIINHNRKY